MTPPRPTPAEILERLYARAVSKRNGVVLDAKTTERMLYVVNCLGNRAGARLLLSCLLAKVDDPSLDPRKPYTQIGGTASFSGRKYDERYISEFINKYRLPLNSTTAFLTPTLRNINQPLTPDIDYEGRPPELYQKVATLLGDVARGKIEASDLLTATLAELVKIREEKLSRMQSLMAMIKPHEGSLPLSSEAVVTLLDQHLACKNASRLPVLMVAAAYEAAGECLGEKALPLLSHNAADLQTGSIGDVEICLADDDGVITAYEMKLKRVTRNDIDNACTKIQKSKGRIHNYLFVTTDEIDPDLEDYAEQFYERLGGTEIAVLDCLGFIRHFLHLFHRRRGGYLDAYQRLLLQEPDSAVSQSLKEVFLALRQAAQSGE